MAAKRPKAVKESPVPRPRIAWAEDSVHDQILIKESLDGVMADVAFAGDGLHLLEAVHDRAPDLVVLDLRMPRLGGLETLRRLRAEPRTRELPVCVFSAGDQPDEVAACRALGALEVVQKPVDFDQYMKAVRRITSRVA